MGFFDKLKKTAQDAMKVAMPEPTPAAQAEETHSQQTHSQQAAPQAAAYSGPTFRWDGDVYPQPPGWEGLSVEDWFFKLETLRDRLMHASDEDLKPMNDDDGNPLDPEEIILILEGFKSGGHYEKFRNWGTTSWSQKLGMGQDPTNLEFKMSALAREKMMAAKTGGMSGAGGSLEPIEGVSCEQWAQINAAIAHSGGANFEQLIANAGMDLPKWDRVKTEWMARMSTDRSGAIATVYGNAFTGAGQGQFSAHAAQAAKVGVLGDLSAEPVSFERYCEIEAAMGCAADRGEDVTQLLARFGMSPMEWGQIGMFWSKKIQQDAMGYHKLHTEYRAKYIAQYSV